MPAPEQAGRYNAAVWWPTVGKDRHGETTRGDGVNLLVNWTTDRRDVRDPKGNMRSVEVTAVLDRRVDPEDLMVLGSLSDWTGTGNTFPAAEVMEVVTYHEQQDVKGRGVRREATLARYRGKLPRYGL